MTKQVKLSIIIVNYNAKDFLLKSIKSIYKTIKNVSFEIFVVDNASFDGVEEVLKQNFPKVNFIQNNQNFGFSKANNQAIRIARGKFILLLNPDTVLTQGAIEAMLSYMEKHPKIGIVGPYLINGYGNTQLSYNLSSFLFPATDQVIDYVYERIHFVKKTLLLTARIENKKPKEVALVMGACLLTKREVFNMVGLLDENFFMFGEDTDFCYRTKKQGFKIMFLPEAFIIHYGGRSSRFLKHKRLIEAKSYIYYFWKNLFQSNLQFSFSKTYFLFFLILFSSLSISFYSLLNKEVLINSIQEKAKVEFEKVLVVKSNLDNLSQKLNITGAPIETFFDLAL